MYIVIIQFSIIHIYSIRETFSRKIRSLLRNVYDNRNTDPGIRCYIIMSIYSLGAIEFVITGQLELDLVGNFDVRFVDQSADVFHVFDVLQNMDDIRC